MLYKSLFTTVSVFAALGAAQTFTDCDPTKKTCPANPALGNKKINCDLTKGECADFKVAAGTNIEYDDQGALFTITNGTQAPTISGNKYIFFGRVDVELRASQGVGVVTSVVLQSADLDEIDWEWLGGDNAQVQTNYFGKGDTSTYDRGAFHAVSEPITTFHKYSIEWTSKKVDWLIDDQVVRTLNYADAKGGSQFPQTPMEIKLGTWVAGLPGNSEGTVEWAGGYTDFTQAPFNAWYKSISVIDYAGRDSATSESIKEYVYGDKSGTWESIKVIRGTSDDGNNNNDNNNNNNGTRPSNSSAPYWPIPTANVSTGSTALTHVPITSTGVAPTLIISTTLSGGDALATATSSFGAAKPETSGASNGTSSSPVSTSITISKPTNLPSGASSSSISLFGTIIAFGATLMMIPML